MHFDDTSLRPNDPPAASLGETLRRARLARRLTLEDAQEATRIPRRYLEALEQEEFSVLPAPVYARGFLRTYVSYLRLDVSALMPLFPVSYLGQPAMEPLPRLERPPVWSASWLVGAGVVGVLILIIVGLYAFGGGEGGPFGSTSTSQEQEPATTPGAPAPAGGEGTQTALTQGGLLPDLRGRRVAQAVDLLRQMGLSYFVLETASDQAPAGVVVLQSPAPGTKLDAGQMVSLVVSRGRR